MIRDLLSADPNVHPKAPGYEIQTLCTKGSTTDDPYRRKLGQRS